MPNNMVGISDTPICFPICFIIIILIIIIIISINWWDQ